MLRRIHPVLTFTAFAALLWIGVATCLAQTSVEEFRRVLRDQATFTANDFSELERGEMVVKLLPVKDKREVAVCGLVRMQAPVEVGLKAFQESMAQQNRNSILEIGRFSSRPTLEDLQELTLEDRDIEDLKRCVVGDCKLKLSAAMIERFHKEVDWVAPNYRFQTTRLFRQILLDYVRDYLSRGDRALIEYHDQSNRVRLAEEQRSLLDASLYINEFAPEFTKHLKSFPKPELPNVENAISWAKINFGLKPVIVITHAATYMSQHNGAPQILVVSKQIYANHYFDSSLALTALINVSTTGATFDSYLLYTNHSRADALGGAFSRLKRKLVESEAVDSLKSILQQTELNLDIHSINQSAPPVSAKQRMMEWLFGGKRRFWWVFAVILFISLLGLIKRNSSRISVSFERDR